MCVSKARQTWSSHRPIPCSREFPSYECSLARKRTVLVIDGKGALESPVVRVMVLVVPPELIAATSDVVDKNISIVFGARTIIPAEGVDRLGENFVAAGVDVA